MSFKTRLFLILFAAGMAGVLTLLLIDLSALIAILPVPKGSEIPPVTPAVRFLSLIQPTVLVALAVYLGVSVAHKVGLSAPVAEAIASGTRISVALKPQVVPGLIGGLVGGIGIVVSALLAKPFLTPEAVTRISGLGQVLPIPTRLLYGGIIEELLLRWGVMTLIVWAGWRLFQKAKDPPKGVFFIAAILISSFLFSIGHLPVAMLLFPKLTIALTLYVIVANSLFGLIAGYLFWKKGLESAMIAHMLTHVVLLMASYLGAYF